MTLTIGELVHHNRYRVDQLLGQGGMGAVYKAWDNSLEMPVAIKENLDTSPEAQKQFNREANLLAHLSHPNLPRVTDYFFIPGQGQYLVMDFVEGEDLKSMLQRLGQLPEPQVLTWIGQISEALAYLHSQPSPIIHRDVKPGNIRIRTDGRAMLVDFGIAKIYDPNLSTTIGAKAITPGYSPPEQYGGGNTDPRSDVYALGATLYNLLTGKEPPESVARMVSSADMPSPRLLNENISPVVEQAILKSVEIPTNRRFQSVDEMHQALTGPLGRPNPPAASASVVVIPGNPPASVPEASGATRAIDKEVLLAADDPNATHTFSEAQLRAADNPHATIALGADSSSFASGRTAEKAQEARKPAAAGSIDTPAPGKKIPPWAWLAGGGLLGMCLLAVIFGLALSKLGGSKIKPTEKVALAASPTAVATTAVVPPTAAPTDAPQPTASPTAEIKPTTAVPSSYNAVGSLEIPGVQSVRAVEEKDGYAYVLAKNNTLYVFDLSALSADQSQTTYNVPASQVQLKNGTGLLRNGDTLYVYGATGIQVLDVKDAAKAAVRNALTGQIVYNLLLYQNYLISAGEGNIGIYDASSAANPKLVNLFNSGENTQNFAAAVYSNMLYVSEYMATEDKSHGLLMVYDFRDPAHLLLAQRIDIGEVAYHIWLVNDQLLMCSTEHVGLWSLAEVDYPRLVVSQRAQARACTVDQGNLITNGTVFKPDGTALQTVQDFDPLGGVSEAGKFGLQGEPIPYGSVTGEKFILVAQSPRVLVLAGVSE